MNGIVNVISRHTTLASRSMNPGCLEASYRIPFPQLLRTGSLHGCGCTTVPRPAIPTWDISTLMTGPTATWWVVSGGRRDKVKRSPEVISVNSTVSASG